MKKIVLRSASPRRKELLEQAGYQFEIHAADIDETLDDKKNPYDNVKILGLKKAIYQKEQFPNCILIGCDTIVVFQNQIFGKPNNEQHAYEMLKALSGHVHQVMSGVGIVYKKYCYNFVVTSDVYFKELTDEDIWAYIQTGECFGKAGSYAIQGIGGKLVARYEGSLTNIIGLPMEEVTKILGEINEMED